MSSQGGQGGQTNSGGLSGEAVVGIVITLLIIILLAIGAVVVVMVIVVYRRREEWKFKISKTYMSTERDVTTSELIRIRYIIIIDKIMVFQVEALIYPQNPNAIPPPPPQSALTGSIMIVSFRLLWCSNFCK